MLLDLVLLYLNEDDTGDADWFVGVVGVGVNGHHQTLVFFFRSASFSRYLFVFFIIYFLHRSVFVKILSGLLLFLVISDIKYSEYTQI